MTNIIHQYKRDNRGNLIGCVCAKKVNSASFSVGWSKLRRGDKFDKKVALEIASERADKIPTEKIPPKLKDVARQFINRGSRYFKDCNYIGEVF